MTVVVDDPLNPDPEYARYLISVPDALDLEPWLSWCRLARGEVLYLGPGAGRLFYPLWQAGVRLVGLEAHPELAGWLARRLPEATVHRGRLETARLRARFDLVMAPSNLLAAPGRLEAARALARRALAFELLNPHWLAAGAGEGVEVLAFEAEVATLRVRQSARYQEEETVHLVWPEHLEARLDRLGLRLEAMSGAEDEDLATSPSYCALASSRRFLPRAPGW